MKRSDQSKYREQFMAVVKRGIQETSRATGITDVDTVDSYVAKNARILFRRISLILAKEQRRIIIQKLLKRCTVSAREAEAQARAHAVQMEFDFFAMEQFRGVSQRITYPQAKEMKYVEYNRSLEWQRELSIAHLNAGIVADVASRDAEISSNNFLRPLVRRHGDLPAEELMRLWLRDRQSASGEGE